jgi:hypothetical protein
MFTVSNSVGSDPSERYTTLLMNAQFFGICNGILFLCIIIVHLLFLFLFFIFFLLFCVIRPMPLARTLITGIIGFLVFVHRPVF